jgi:hypothetical protein
MKRVSFTAGLVVAGLLFTAQANAREGQALVQSISGEVTMLANGGKWLPLQTGEMLKSGAVVKTGAKSRVDLFLGINGSMLRLAANTELKFTRLAIEQSPIEPIAQTEMELISGRVIGNVRKLPMGSSYVIKTPKGVAKVKGTVYDINADGELIVLSGKVRYTDNASGKEVLIASGGKYVGGREVKAADDEKAEAAAAAPANGLSFTIGVPLRQGVWENQPNHQKGGPIDPTQFIAPLFNFQGNLQPRAGELANPQRIEIPVTAATASMLDKDKTYSATDLGLKILGKTISDNDAIIVLEQNEKGTLHLVVTAKEGGGPLLPADAIGAKVVPVVVTLPLPRGASVDVNISLIAPRTDAEITAMVDLESGTIKSIEIISGGFTEDEIKSSIDDIKNQYGTADYHQIGGNTLNADEVDIIVEEVPTGDPLTPFAIKTVIKPKDSEGDLGPVVDDIGQPIDVAFQPPPVEVVPGEIPPPSIKEAPAPPKISPIEG